MGGSWRGRPCPTKYCRASCGETAYLPTRNAAARVPKQYGYPSECSRLYSNSDNSGKYAFPEDFLEISHSSKMRTAAKACLTPVTKNADAKVSPEQPACPPGWWRVIQNSAVACKVIFLKFSWIFPGSGKWEISKMRTSGGMMTEGCIERSGCPPHCCRLLQNPKGAL